MNARDWAVRMDSSTNLEHRVCLRFDLEASFSQEGEHKVRPYGNFGMDSPLENTQHRPTRDLENTSWTVFSR